MGIDIIGGTDIIDGDIHDRPVDLPACRPASRPADLDRKQAGTCQILSLAKNPRWSPSVAKFIPKNSNRNILGHKKKFGSNKN